MPGSSKTSAFAVVSVEERLPWKNLRFNHLPCSLSRHSKPGGGWGGGRGSQEVREGVGGEGRGIPAIAANLPSKKGGVRGC